MRLFFSSLTFNAKIYFASFLVSVVIMNGLSNSYLHRPELAQLLWLMMGFMYNMSEKVSLEQMKHRSHVSKMLTLNYLALIALATKNSTSSLLKKYCTRWMIERGFFNMNTNEFEIKRPRITSPARLEMLIYLAIERSVYS